MKATAFVLACGLAWGPAAGPARADDPRGRIAGSVTSRDGARLPGVVLVLTSARDGSSSRLSTGSLGSFRSPELAPGAQRVYGACPNHMDPASFHVDFAEVDRVEVGKGPFDLKNQGGLGGTVNVVTRKPEPGWHATPALAAGSFGLLNPSLTLGRGGERLSALTGYSHRRSLPYRDGDGRRFTELANYRPENREDEAFSIGTAWGRVVWAPAAGHQVDLAYTRQDSGAIPRTGSLPVPSRRCRRCAAGSRPATTTGASSARSKASSPRTRTAWTRRSTRPGRPAGAS